MKIEDNTTPRLQVSKGWHIDEKTYAVAFYTKSETFRLYIVLHSPAVSRHAYLESIRKMYFKYIFLKRTCLGIFITFVIRITCFYGSSTKNQVCETVLSCSGTLVLFQPMVVLNSYIYISIKLEEWYCHVHGREETLLHTSRRFAFTNTPKLKHSMANAWDIECNK